MSVLLAILLIFTSIFLILLVLIQRGRGGGLAGAFGGMGGQSAFGTKAGDVFTRITIGVATGWILLCAVSVVALSHTSGQRSEKLFENQPAGIPVEKAGPAGNQLGNEAAVEPGLEKPVAPP